MFDYGTGRVLHLLLLLFQLFVECFRNDNGFDIATSLILIPTTTVAAAADGPTTTTPIATAANGPTVYVYLPSSHRY